MAGRIIRPGEVGINNRMEIVQTDKGLRCKITCQTPQGDFPAYYPPVQFIEMGKAMIELGQAATIREGVEASGRAERSATVILPTIRFDLKSGAGL